MISHIQRHWVELFAVLSVSVACAGPLVLINRLPAMRRAAVGDLFAAQAAHLAPTPRLGGVPLLVAIIFSLVFLSEAFRAKIGLLLLCAAPLFLTGLREDVCRDVRPMWRLAAAAVASAIVIATLDRWLLRLDIPIVDDLMTFAPFAWLVTIFAVTGLSHAFNIIDGMNGLCLSVAMAAATAIALMAFAMGDRDFAAIMLLCVAAMFGVFVWNYPFGKVFLGDAGAYLIGFLIAWSAAALVWRNPQVSAWAVLLACFWPVAETTLAIVRRARQRRLISQPDSGHMHHLVLRLLEARWFGSERRRVANPLTTAVMAPFFLAPPVAGALLWDAPATAFLVVMAFAVLFVAMYGLLTRELARTEALHAIRSARWRADPVDVSRTAPVAQKVSSI